MFRNSLSRLLVSTASRWGMVALLALAFFLLFVKPARATFTTITPLTWNVIGLDSNNVNVGPNHFPVGARVCSDGATTATVNFVWDDGRNAFTGDPYINLRQGTNSSLTLTFAGAGCQDAYFEVEVNRDSNAYNKTRRYRITATDGSGTISTSTPRELFVEYLISQSRNSVTDLQLSTTGAVGSYVSIPNGGTMSLLVGNTYWIKLVGSTATNGYEQIESFINFPNTIFQVLSVSTTWSAHSLPTPYDRLYGDGCGWENNPLSPNYRSCLSTGKNGGNVTVTYQVRILSAPTAPLTNPQPLSTLIYDFSGSSYHYNADFGTSTRYTYIVNPADIKITKKFVPDTILPNGTSILRFTIPNTTTVAISGVNFTDILPSGVVISNTVGASTTGCGSPTFSPTAGSGSLAFSNGTIAPNSSCVIQVNVTSPSTGTYPNTTGRLYINGTTPGTGIDTGNTASATLNVVSALAPACTPGLTMANWTVPNTASTAPPDNGAGAPTVKAGNVVTATASASAAGYSTINTSTGFNDSRSWQLSGFKGQNQTVDFVVDTRHYSNVFMTLHLYESSPTNGPNNVYVSYNNGAGFTNVLTIPKASIPATTWLTYTIGFTDVTSINGTTTFRINSDNSANNDSASILLDDIKFTGCSQVPPPPTLSKAFSVSPIPVNGTSRLTFTFSNSQAGYEPLTNVRITDTLPSGLQVANPPNSNITGAGCTGVTFNPTAGATTLNYIANNMAANATCTAYVDVTATRAGQFDNVSDYISASESGANKTSTGYGTASLTAIAPPTIAKQYSASPIFVGNTTVLTYTITNPNPSTTLNGIAFTDSLPAGVSVATTSSSTCGGTLSTTNPSSISFTGGSLAGGASCTFTVTVTGNSAGTYTHTTSNITSTNGGTGNTATATVEVRNQTPRISLLKQISTDQSTWVTYIYPVSPGTNVYYRFKIENTGDVALSSLGITDPRVDASGCTWPNPLPVAVVANDNHIATCIVGPISSSGGTVANTATAQGSYNSTVYNSSPSTATYSNSPTAVKLSLFTAKTATKTNTVALSQGWELGAALMLLVGITIYHRRK